MKAQFPFNLADLEELNITYYDEDREKRDKIDISIMIQNLKRLGMYSGLTKEFSDFLDVGFGTGKLLRHLKENGKGSYFGIEPIKEVFDLTKKSFKDLDPPPLVENVDLESYIPKVKFNYIHSFFVLEHLLNPILLFEKASEWLKREGILITTCPNDSGFIPKHFKSRHAIESHRWLPDKKTLFKVLDDYDFNVIEWFTYGGFSSPRNIFKNIGNKILKILDAGDVICFAAQKK
tara:strand:- start:259 stop:960 length:702 start_codon:yes stop_codon:yes gene_type:complete